jgi:glycosyltransferase involved in cell wall biosynthesis
VFGISPPDEGLLLQEIVTGRPADPERCFQIARERISKADYIVGECTEAFLWHAVFRLAGDATPFIIIPRFNHCHPLHAYALLLSSRLRHPQDVLFTGCGSAAAAFGGFGFTCVPSYLPGLDLSTFRPLPKEKCEIRASLGLPQDRDVLLYTGRAADDKNLIELLEIVQNVRNVRPVELVICYHFSREEYVEECQRRAEAMGGVRFVQRPPVETLVRYYNAADLFVSAAVSRYETFGRSPVEAMACGVPPVVSDYNGFRETVTPETGYLVPTHGSCTEKKPDLDGFTQTLLAALADRRGLEERGRRGIRRAPQFEIARTLQALLERLEPRSPAAWTPADELSTKDCPVEIQQLFPSIEGKSLNDLVRGLIRTGQTPALPSREATEKFAAFWFSSF